MAARRWTQDCGCTATAYEDTELIDIEYCPMHRTAEVLLSLSQEAVMLLANQSFYNQICALLTAEQWDAFKVLEDRLRAVIRQAKGESL